MSSTFPSIYINSIFLALLLIICSTTVKTNFLSIPDNEKLNFPNISSDISQTNCPYYFNIDQSLSIINQNKNISNKSTYSLIIISSNEITYSNYLQLKKILDKISNPIISTGFFCNVEQNKKTEFILLHENSILLDQELPNNLDMVSNIKKILKNVISAQLLFETTKKIDKKFIEVPQKQLKLLSRSHDEAKLVENNRKIMNNMDNNNTKKGIFLELNSSPNYSVSLTHGFNKNNEFIQIQQNNIDKGKRLLITIIILIISGLSVLGLIKYSLEWANMAVLELNKNQENLNKKILERVVFKNNSLQRLE